MSQTASTVVDTVACVNSVSRTAQTARTVHTEARSTASSIRVDSLTTSRLSR